MTETNPALRGTDPSSAEAAGTAALLQALVPMVIPLICKQVSQSMIDDPGQTVLLNEEPLKEGDKAPVLQDIQLKLTSMALVDPDTLKSDMEKMPKFAWPEANRYAHLMKNQRMTVLDISALTLTILLGKGIEFAFPTVSTFGKKINLEVGCGGKNIGDDAYFELHIPKLRLWIVLNEQIIQPPSTKKHVYTKVYAALLGRPNLTPHVHINADRGKGDFFEMDLAEEGSLDEVVENVLMAFGPSEYKEEAEKDKKKTKDSWVGNALGKQIRKLLDKFVGLNENKPYELDMTESITDSVEGKPRQVADIEADLERIQQELEIAKKYYQEHPDEVKVAKDDEKKESN
ncbi:expressed unknown protein [Seminavis robusta]|uniref:Uncharacterized protein n=1 Tax=Seminavis robusta TaxID=568900 RepID=A0A9N8DZL4_9STRA|nr:expressed unknown protein [Seminavis robusta]|eukprot:Sro504_g155920.1 n/a (345) ;mRNA; r:9717-10751